MTGSIASNEITTNRANNTENEFMAMYMPGHILRPKPNPAVKVGVFPSKNRSGWNKSAFENIY